MVYTIIAFGIIMFCIGAVVYTQNTAIRVLKGEINRLNEANDYNLAEIRNVIDETNMEWRKRANELEKFTNRQINLLEDRIRKDFDTEKTQRNTY